MMVDTEVMKRGGEGEECVFVMSKYHFDSLNIFHYLYKVILYKKRSIHDYVHLAMHRENILSVPLAYSDTGMGFIVGSTTQRLSLGLLLCPHRRHGQLGSVSAHSGAFGVIIFCVVPPDVHGRGAVLGGHARGVGHLSILLV